MPRNNDKSTDSRAQADASSQLPEATSALKKILRYLKAGYEAVTYTLLESALVNHLKDFVRAGTPSWLADSVQHLNKAASPLQGLGNFINSMAGVLPPLRLALMILTGIVGAVKAVFVDKESKLSIANKIFFTALIVALSVAAIAAAGAALMLLTVAAGIEVIRDMIETAKETFTLHKVSKQLSEKKQEFEFHHEILEARKNLCELLLQHKEAAKKEDKVALKNLAVRIAQAEEKLPATDDYFKITRTKNLSDITAIGHLELEIGSARAKLKKTHQEIQSLSDKARQITKSRDEKIAAVVCGTVATVGLGLMFTPLAPIGVGLLIASMVGSVVYHTALSRLLKRTNAKKYAVAPLPVVATLGHTSTSDMALHLAGPRLTAQQKAAIAKHELERALDAPLPEQHATHVPVTAKTEVLAPQEPKPSATNDYHKRKLDSEDNNTLEVDDTLQKKRKLNPSPEEQSDALKHPAPIPTPSPTAEKTNKSEDEDEGESGDKPSETRKLGI